MSEELTIIRTLDGMLSLSDYLQDKEYVAYDTETTGLTSEATLIGFSVAAETNKGFYVVLQEWDPTNQVLKPTEIHSKDICEFLSELSCKNLICHNAVFDCARTLDNVGADLMPSVHTDTMCLAHLLNENRLIGLKPLSLAAGDLSTMRPP